MEQMAEEPKSRPLFTKIKKAICFGCPSPIVLTKVLRKEDKMADDVAEAGEQEALEAAAAAGKNEMTESPGASNIASATDLHNLGIRFETTKSAVGSQYHVRINSDKGMLVIPPVVVSGTTAPLLHNLIAFEQQEREDKQQQEREDELIIGAHFTKYAFLMYNLVNSDEDISLLRSRGILLNNYGTNEQVISYFKNLLLFMWNYRTPATRTMAIVTALDALEARTKHRAYRYWAEVMRYCNSPVKILLLFTSFLVFLSTIVQAVSTIPQMVTFFSGR